MSFFALLPNYSAMAFVNAVETLRLANLLSKTTLFEVFTCAEGGNDVRDSLGSLQSVDMGFETLRVRDLILVCSGGDVHLLPNVAITNWLRRNVRVGVGIGGLNTGAYILAKAGLLDGRRASIHWEFHHTFKEEFPQIELSNYSFCCDPQLYSTASGMASVDLMLRIVAETADAELSGEVSAHLGYSSIHTLQSNTKISAVERMGTRHPKIAAVVALMETNLEEPMRPNELAKSINISTRQLERLFRRYLEKSPKKFYNELRLQHTHLMLLQTNSSVTNVALSCGFQSMGNFSKLFLNRYGISPHKFRVGS